MIRSLRLFSRFFSLLLAAVFACALTGAAALAQNAETPRLDAARAALDRIEKTLERKDLPDAVLQGLRADAEPVAANIEELLRQIEPKREAARLRLEQLGKAPEPVDTKPVETKPGETKLGETKPGETPPGEVDETASERAQQQKAFNEFDGLFKRARLLAVKSEQLIAEIVNRRRDLFRQALFQRSSSVLSPNLWINASGDLPRDAQALSVLASDWAGGVANKLRGPALASFLASLAAIGLFFRCFAGSRGACWTARHLWPIPRRCKKPSAHCGFRLSWPRSLSPPRLR